jgi:hypothetical protein
VATGLGVLVLGAAAVAAGGVAGASAGGGYGVGGYGVSGGGSAVDTEACKGCGMLLPKTVAEHRCPYCGKMFPFSFG